MNYVNSIYTTINKANIRLSNFVCMNTVPSTVYSVHYISSPLREEIQMNDMKNIWKEEIHKINTKYLRKLQNK